jgi:hypothetical protein
VDIKEIGHGDVGWIHMAENGAYQSVVNTEIRFVLHGLNVRQCIEWRRDREFRKIYSAALIYLAYNVLLLIVLHGISLREEHIVINLKEFGINFNKGRWDMQGYRPLGKVKNRTRMWQMTKILHSLHIHGYGGCRMLTRVIVDQRKDCLPSGYTSRIFQ